MRKQALILLCTLISSAVALGQQAELSFDDDLHKFPTTIEGEQLEHTFHFQNTGDQPLMLSRFEAECSCTKAFFSKEPIPPGQKGEVKVTFDTAGKIGWQYRKVTLYSNSKKSPTEIEIRVKVKAGE